MISRNGARFTRTSIGDLANVAELLKQAHQRADLFTAIVESMGESVLVVDREGKEIYSNQELKRFRGDVRPEDDLDAWRSPRRMRIFDAQRRELAPEQWPVARALRGDYSTNFEIIVEGMAHPQGDPGYASQSETSQIGQLPPFAFLRKPYSLLELARAARSALRATRVANVG